MTTEIVCVPRDELSELLQDGVNYYWITTESGAKIIEILRASLAQPIANEPVAFMLDNAVGGSCLDFQRDDLLDDQNRYGGEIVTLYRHPPAPVIPDGHVCKFNLDMGANAFTAKTPRDRPMNNAKHYFPSTHTEFKFGDHVHKTKGSCWSGFVVGWYSTSLTPEGYAIESSTEHGSVQIYPASALELKP